MLQRLTKSTSLHTLQPPSAAKSTKSMTEHRDGEVATAAESSEKKKSCCSPLHRNLIIAVIFVGIGIPVSLYNPFYAYVWFLGIPMICLLLQYLWLRLCRDPFLSQRYVLHDLAGWIKQRRRHHHDSPQPFLTFVYFPVTLFQ